MLTYIIEQIERMVLHLEPQRSVRFLNVSPPWAIEAMQRARFRRTLQLAAERSLFYQEQFRKRGIDVRRIAHPSELGEFYTTGEDLRAFGAEAFLTGRADTAFETTGTTSPIPKRVFFSHRELDEMGRTSAIGLYHLGIRAEDRVFSAYDCSFWVSPVVLRVGLQYLKCFHVEAGKIAPEEFYERAHAYKPNVIFGEPSWLVRLSELAHERGTWPVKLLFGGGENIAEDARHAVESVCGAPLYLSYGQTESFGTLGAECQRQDGYHRNDLFFFFETPETDTDGYEMLVCGMGNVGPWVFAEVLRDVNGHGADWQAVIKHDGRRDVIELRVELEHIDRQPDLERAVLDNLRKGFANFWKNYEMKLYEFRVVPCQLGSLRNGRKLKQVVDQREMALRRTL